MKFTSLLPVTILVTLAVLLNISCTKINPTDIGTDLLPTVDNVHTFDTLLRVYADNYLFNDSSSIHYSEDHALGVIEDDPEFGKTESQIYFSVVPASSSRNPFVSVDSIVAMDSVILSLAYTGVFGDSNAVQKINVYEVSDTSFRDSVGYLVNHPEFNTTGTVLGSTTVNFTTLDDAKTVIVKKDTQNITNLLRIPLNPSLGMRFAAYDTGSVYLSAKRDSAFQKVFNGLALKIDEAGSPLKNALAYYKLSNENTKLTFYFRITKNGIVDTVKTDFLLYTAVSASGTYSTAYSANLVKRTAMHGYATLNLTTPVVDADKVYLQTSPGSFALLKIPGLTGLNNRIIHRAEISFKPVDIPANSVYTSPRFLFLDVIDSVNNRFLTVRDDFNYSFSSYTYDYQLFGGFLKSGKYFINLTRYVQNLVTTSGSNYAFRLYAPKTAIPNYVYPKESGSIITGRVGITVNPQIANGRAVVGGGSNSANPMVLRIIYSKI